jgi:hypothetical protein
MQYIRKFAKHNGYSSCNSAYGNPPTGVDGADIRTVLSAKENLSGTFTAKYSAQIGRLPFLGTTEKIS